MKEFKIEDLRLKLKCKDCNIEMIIGEKYNKNQLNCPFDGKSLLSEPSINETLTLFNKFVQSIIKENNSGSKISIIIKDEI
ncbi:hypothetical protein ACOL28_03870 [Aliarcobacter butzleri]